MLFAREVHSTAYYARASLIAHHRLGSLYRAAGAGAARFVDRCCGGTPELVRLRGKIRLNVVSPGWVPETLKAMGRDPAKDVRAAVVAQAHQKCILEDISQQVVSVTH